MKNKLAIILIVLGIAGLAAAALIIAYRQSGPASSLVNQPVAGESQTARATYACADGKSIMAGYFEGPAIAVTPGEQSAPTGRVALKLSDGRALDLPRTISGSGVRFANADESIVFWNKGDAALFVEGGEETYASCNALPSANLPVVGGDRDEHGCIGSAGYSWCEILKKCLRPWEEKCEKPAVPVSTSVEYMTSKADPDIFCNGADMDSEGYRKTITQAGETNVTRTDLVLADKVKAAIRAASGDRCKQVADKVVDGITIKNGVVYIPPVEGYAGVSIALCSCKPLYEVNAHLQEGVARVVWQ
jgi:membrane-bound inhibitor of C-type lysozyme